MHRSLRALAASVAALALTGTLAACGGSGDGSGGDTHLVVFAASSLTSTFTRLKSDFEQSHPGVTVDLDFGGSSTLVEQIQSGAPADVFASADETNMKSLGATAQSPKDFATNVLQIATPPDNPAKITDFADLGKPGVKVVVCATEVPCGAATAQMEQVTHTAISPVSEEQSVTDVLGKVTSGEADAGVVYVTDVKAAGTSVTGIPIAQADKVVNTYPIATLQDAKQPELAQQWVDLVLGSQGQRALKAAGFGAP